MSYGNHISDYHEILLVAVSNLAYPSCVMSISKVDFNSSCNVLITVNWLKTEESLCEQGIVETDMLTLRKKFFVSDQHTHYNDPVQIDFLYAQLRDAIINGSLPCTRDESVHLTALQCQIIHGSYDKHRQKPGFLDLHNFLPNQYSKQKGIEKLILRHIKSCLFSQKQMLSSSIFSFVSL